MNVLIDTNVILDVLLRREPFYKDAARISALSEKGYVRCYISASTVTDVYYVARKELKRKDFVLNLIRGFIKNIHIASVAERNIYEALDLEWDDFEDSVQYVIGKSISAEYIITRNPEDFSNSQINVISPKEFLSKIILHN
jgi:predicted nucleic acid-binding protein